ncbi:MAG: hypothetical protein A3A94_02785 [Candidatus Portnoybacteria bacterium RIFCSPLOWO2_01_FULL_43_11]|uniref:Uncharacterized protein n=4 Tax=Candidatus Portnoyibacteriota TaxID=1817913 RepID=A0A1G2FAJ6_9BACT|nr:MAG: hypothetical protein A2815_01280 [Candidatus Portnoybacteria bacterium RIFCSPHIGHO2_01_FULL_40_12b]OGZ36931.1 MAG: hypothetical protein A3D38_02450 [Candidatus Portnoybacteria bacterium RIFCSPHIGHO2_02_FULL_40_23]OGZ37599.1 MAG: hypothetical protein A3E90_00395 [Candidatus Portnoybacteria bacterium RIFCSPHIGHO2_12_FULL_40_11]OGZ38033.1 MAG: hypothetical protein A3A94_02785 [Candidatus Portnoybacteria bacterium RIFCSPLOWO2_01_FULL_43_11]OGZ40998.1 MAG: hypothetical protein A3I20_01145 [C
MRRSSSSAFSFLRKSVIGQYRPLGFPKQWDPIFKNFKNKKPLFLQRKIPSKKKRLFKNFFSDFFLCGIRPDTILA